MGAKCSRQWHPPTHLVLERAVGAERQAGGLGRRRRCRSAMKPQLMSCRSAQSTLLPRSWCIMLSTSTCAPAPRSECGSVGSGGNGSGTESGRGRQGPSYAFRCSLQAHVVWLAARCVLQQESCLCGRYDHPNALQVDHQRLLSNQNRSGVGRGYLHGPGGVMGWMMSMTSCLCMSEGRTVGSMKRTSR